MATADKLNKLLSTKAAIKAAIIDKGVEVGEDEPFANYANKIAAIEVGNGEGGNPIYEVYFNAKTENNTNYNKLFYDYKGSKLDVSNLDTSNVTNMYSMFTGCSNLTSLDVSNFNTGNVINMYQMFKECRSLTELDVSNFNTSNVTNMYSMFSGCSKLTSLDVNNLDISSATDIGYMFNGCSKLTSLDLSKWNTNNVTSMGGMFGLCSNLETLDIRNFDMSNVTNTDFMFFNSKKLHTLRLDNCSAETISKIIKSSKFPTDTVYGGREIWCNPDVVDEELMASVPEGWVLIDKNTGSEVILGPKLYEPWEFRDHEDKDSLTEVTTMVDESHDNLSEMFQDCSNLTTINGIDQWNTSNVTNMGHMFEGCRSLETLVLGKNWETGKVTSMESMFKDCESLRELSITEYFNMSNVNDTNNMFENCRRLHTLHLDFCEEETIRKIIESDWFPTGEAEDNWGETRKIYCLEKNVGKLTAPDGWEFVDCETGEIIGEKLVNYEKGMFSENRDIEEVNVMVTKEHTDLSDMFQFCENLKTINGINEWDTSNVETMAGMFADCKSLESLDLSSFNTSQVTNMMYMFSGCENLRELNLSNFDMCNIRETWNTDMMFDSCRKLHTLRLDNCSRETVERIINSSDLPTGKADDWGETRKIYYKRPETYDLIPPDGWEFEYVD